MPIKKWLPKQPLQKIKTEYLSHLTEDCIALLKNAESIIDVNVMEDPNYKVAIDL
jgi:SulP family sulfate permease